MIPDTLVKAAQAAACGETVSHIAVWENCPLYDENLVRIPKAGDGVCAALVKDERGEMIMKPFLWREDLADREIELAEALFKIGVGKDAMDAAAALIGGE